MKGPTLVIMAAGMGSRYGGLKQMDRIGLGGEALLDYSVYDALRSGFTQAVFIIRHDIEKDFKEIVLNRLGPRLPYRLAFQETCSLIPADLLEGVRRTGRTKPWGTTHALLCAAPLIDAPFAVINADDFYGRPAFEAMAKFLSVPDCREGALVPYRLEKTLSSTGSVTRGVCAIRDGFLVSVEELMGLEKQGRAILNTGPGGERRELPPDAPVSMNFWGFPTAIFPDLERYFLEFISASWG
ncbi:MAG: hypothetical protein LBQ61_01675, partial [Spirochaetales bacterium]|nr:hypothetical protein [Spirochaetales bacterium]